MRKLRLKAVFFVFSILLSLPPILSAAPSEAMKKRPEGKRPPPPAHRAHAFQISGVAVNPREFNPAKGQTITVAFRLSRHGKAVVRIFDAEMRLIRELPVREGKRDSYEVAWNGRDFAERIVPNGAYFFTVEALDNQRKPAVYEPFGPLTAQSFMPKALRFEPREKVLSYTLARDAWVLIRVGIPAGPLLKTVLDFVPRLAGEHREFWDGMDESGNISVVSQEGWKLMYEAVSLPENCMIVVGQPDDAYYDYMNRIAKEKPRKRPPALDIKGRLGTPLPEKLMALELRPGFLVDLPRTIGTTAGGLPVVHGRVPIRVTLDDNIKRYATERRYEIMIFVDFQFVTEEDEGYSPATRMWDSRSVPNGEHIITINVRILGGPAESASQKVMVQN